MKRRKMHPSRGISNLRYNQHRTGERSRGRSAIAEGKRLHPCYEACPDRDHVHELGRRARLRVCVQYIHFFSDTHQGLSASGSLRPVVSLQSQMSPSCVLRFSVANLLEPAFPKKVPPSSSVAHTQAAEYSTVEVPAIVCPWGRSPKPRP